ncbi:MAG: HEPN domain-containing protein [Acidobacteria bacterium]|nr:HEPN domain-containing protein [Acidobacteriota bacterium]
MIVTNDLKSTARARLRDAEVLLKAKRFDGAFYLCGYAVELALKARICRTLKWPGFPETNKEFEGLQSIKTHDLEILLRFSGVEDRVKTKYFAEWSQVLDWNSQKRYQSSGQTTSQQATDMVTCAKRLLTAL